MYTHTSFKDISIKYIFKHLIMIYYAFILSTLYKIYIDFVVILRHTLTCFFGCPYTQNTLVKDPQVLRIQYIPSWKI